MFFFRNERDANDLSKQDAIIQEVIDHFEKNRDLFETFSGSIKFRSTITRHKKKINIINLS
jgi:hypothetical protein